MIQKNNIYLVIGVPGSGKSWACSQVKDLFLYLEHDSYIANANPIEAYVQDIKELAPISKKPLLIETPFSVSKLYEPLFKSGLQVILLYLCEDRYTLTDRYKQREGKDIPKGHLTRNRTFMERASASGDFVGTSEALLAKLKEIAGENANGL